MKIAFWSNGRGKAGVTSNLACISLAFALGYSYKAIIMENHVQKNKLEDVLRYNLYKYRREIYYSSRQVGIGHVINYCAMEDIVGYNEKNRVIKEAAFEILPNSLYYLPMDYIQNSMSFDYSLSSNITGILEELESFADITCIDTSGSNCLSTKMILEEADLVVVNLIQNVSQIEKFFDEYSSILKKSVFLISNYQKKSNQNITKIFKSYFIDTSNIVAIPFNTEYQEAAQSGTVVEFMTRNYKCGRKNPNYRFVYRVKKAANMIVNNIEVTCKEKGVLCVGE